MALTYVQILDALEEIETTMAERQAEWEEAARRSAKAKRDFELAYSRAFISADGAEGLRKATANDACARNKQWGQRKEAEAAELAAQRICGLLRDRAMILMALLKSQTRETGPVPMPSWSGQ